MGNKQKVCVIGSGNGAFTVAAKLSLGGSDVILWDCPEFKENLEAIRDERKIYVEENGERREAILYMVTGDMKEALDEADIILVVIPSFAFAKTAKSMVPYLRNGQYVFLCAGSTGGALEVAKIFHDEGVLEKIKLGEYCTLPYGCKKTGSNEVRIATVLKYNLFSAFPARENEEVFPVAAALFDNVKPAMDVVECSLNNGNILSHGPVMLLNAAHTEGAPDNYHYRDGITPSVARLLDKMDEERMAVGDALGHPHISLAQSYVYKGYCPQLEQTTYETFRSSDDFMHSAGPTTLNHRYMTEDIPFSALPVAVLGKQLGIKTPLIEALITLSEGLMDSDYRNSGRTASRLGIDGKNREEIINFLRDGYPEQAKSAS